MGEKNRKGEKESWAQNTEGKCPQRGGNAWLYDVPKGTASLAGWSQILQSSPYPMCSLQTKSYGTSNPTVGLENVNIIFPHFLLTVSLPDSGITS